MQVYHLVNLSFFISLYHLAIQYVHMSVEIIYETISCNRFYYMCCANEMICNALLAIWNGFCIIMNHVHNYFCCHIIICMEMILVYTETWKNSQTMIMLFLNNFTYTLWPHQCFLAIACESIIATGKNLYPKIIISKH